MSTGLLKILDINGLSYLYTKLNNSITAFQDESKKSIDAAVASANSAAERANAIVDNADSSYATKEELVEAIGNIVSFDFSIVSSLPETGSKGIIYLVANESGNQANESNVYDEYIWIDSKFEKIGSTSINLSEYLKSEDASNTYTTKEAYNGKVAELEQADADNLTAAKKYADEAVSSLAGKDTRTEFTSDGSIKDVYADGSYKMTKFNSDGSISCDTYDKNGVVIKKENIIFNGDGSITTTYTKK